MIPYSRAMWAREIDPTLPLPYLYGVSMNRAVTNQTTTTHAACDWTHIELCQFGRHLDRALEQAYHEVETLVGSTLYPVQRHEQHAVLPARYERRLSHPMKLTHFLLREDWVRPRHAAQAVGTLRVLQVGTVAVLDHLNWGEDPWGVSRWGTYWSGTDTVTMMFEMNKSQLFPKGFFRLRMEVPGTLYNATHVTWDVTETGSEKWGVPNFLDADAAWYPSQAWVSPIEVGVREKSTDATKVTIEVRAAKGLLVLPEHWNACVDVSVETDVYAEEVSLEYVYVDPRESPIGVINPCGGVEHPFDETVAWWLTGKVNGDGERIKVLPYGYTYSNGAWTGGEQPIPTNGTYLVNYVSGVFPTETGELPSLYRRLVALLATHYLATVENIEVGVCGSGCRWNTLSRLLFPPLFRTVAVDSRTNERYSRNPNEGTNGFETNRRPATHAYGDTVAGDQFYNLLKQVPTAYEYAALGRFDGVTSA